MRHTKQKLERFMFWPDYENAESQCTYESNEVELENGKLINKNVAYKRGKGSPVQDH